MKELDDLDRKILNRLDRNARESYTNIAEALDIPQPTARYRVKRLFDNRVILNSYTIINLALLGKALYTVFYKLRNLDREAEERIINSLVSNSSIPWVARLFGAYDLAWSVSAQNPFHLSEVINNFGQKFHNNISDRALSVHLVGNNFPRDYLLSKPRDKTNPFGITRAFGTQTLDEVNRTILKHLAMNARLSAVELSELLEKDPVTSTKLSSDAILQRIKKLEDTGIIRGYGVNLNNDFLGIARYKVLLYFSNASPGSIEALAQHCESHPHVTYTVQTIGDWDFELNIDVPRVRVLHDFVMQLSHDHSSLIRKYDTLALQSVPKTSFYYLS